MPSATRVDGGIRGQGRRQRQLVEDASPVNVSDHETGPLVRASYVHTGRDRDDQSPRGLLLSGQVVDADKGRVHGSESDWRLVGNVAFLGTETGHKLSGASNRRDATGRPQGEEACCAQSKAGAGQVHSTGTFCARERRVVKVVGFHESSTVEAGYPVRADPDRDARDAGARRHRELSEQQHVAADQE
jgi:hypothetical protein